MTCDVTLKQQPTLNAKLKKCLYARKNCSVLNFDTVIFLGIYTYLKQVDKRENRRKQKEKKTMAFSQFIKVKVNSFKDFKELTINREEWQKPHKQEHGC